MKLSFRQRLIGLVGLAALIITGAWFGTDYYLTSGLSAEELAGSDPPGFDPNARFWTATWGPIPKSDPTEFEKQYGKYFTTEYQEQQARSIDPQLNPDRLHRSLIRTSHGPIGTLFINNTGEVVVAVKQPHVEMFSEGLAVVSTYVNPKGSTLERWGFVDRSGQLVIPGQYQAALSFHEGLAAVQQDQQWGFINRRGEVVIPFKYKWVEPFRDGLAAVHPESRTTQYIDTKGNVLLTGEGVIGEFSEGLLYQNLPGTGPKDDGRNRGYVDRDQKLMIRLGMDSSGFRPGDCEPFHGGFAAVEIGSRKWGFIDRQGKLIVPANFKQVAPFSEELAAVQIEEGRHWGYVDTTGAMAIKPTFLSAGPFREGLALVTIQVDEEVTEPTTATGIRSRSAYIDRTGKEVLPAPFYRAEPFQNGLARVQQHPYHHGYINKQGEYVWQVTDLLYEKYVMPPKRLYPEPTGPKANLALELTAAKLVIKLGENPKLNADLINKSTDPIVIILPGDGSVEGWRTPIVRWKPAIQMMGRCGNTNALKDSEVVTIQPGQRFTLPGWIHPPTLGKVGKHQVVMEIENIPSMKFGGLSLGKHSTWALAQVRRSLPYKATSNSVEIEVRE